MGSGFTNKSSWIKSIQGAAQQVVLQQATKLLPRFQEIAKESVEDLEAIDTGLLKSRTNARVFQRIKTIVIQFNTKNVEYAKYVYFGLGTNKKYGARKFNLISAQKAKQLIEKGSYTRSFAQGGSNRSNDLKAGKRKNILQRRARLFKTKTGLTVGKAKKLGIYEGLQKAIKATRKKRKR